MQEHKHIQPQNQANSLTPNETKIISLMRSGKYQAINIRFRDKTPHTLDLTEHHQPKQRLVDLLRQTPYQNLIVKTHQGRISHIEQTTKLFLLD